MINPISIRRSPRGPPDRFRGGARRDDDDLRRGLVAVAMAAVAAVVLGATVAVAKNPLENSMENLWILGKTQGF